jgi:hypothetical protein
MFSQKIKKPQRPEAERSDLQTLFDDFLAAAKNKSVSSLTDYFLDEGLDFSKLHIYGDTILSRMTYEASTHKIDILNADINHEFNTLINLYRFMLEGTTLPLMPSVPAMDGEHYDEIPDDDYKREIMVGLLKRGDMRALNLDVMNEKFYLACCGRFGLSDVVGWFLVVALDAKLKNQNLGFHIAQFSEVALDTNFILNHSTYGYALGGFLQKVDNLIDSGADINHAVRGYAEGGFSIQAKQLIDRKASRHDAVKGYIASGIFNQLETFFLQEPGLLNTAVASLKNPENAYYTLFIKVPQTHADEYQRIMAGREKALLRIISPINNAELRQQFLEKIARAGAQLNDLASLLEKAEKINVQLQIGEPFENAYRSIVLKNSSHLLSR